MKQAPRGLALDWEDIRFFVTLAHHRTVAAAARALDVAPELVERRLASFENTIGHSLFRRTGNSLELNPAGAAALAEAAQMEMAACSLTQLRARQLSPREAGDCTGGCDPRRR